MDMYQAIADPTRRHILELLADKGTLSSSDISDKFHMSAPAISQHLKVLRETKLVAMEKDAQKHLYTINVQGFSGLETWIQKMTRQWHERLERLDNILKEEKRKIKGGEK